MRLVLYAIVLVLALGSVAAAGEKAAETGIELLVKSLDAADLQNGAAIASALKGALLQLGDVPTVHTHSFAARLQGEGERRRALEQTAALEKVLDRIGRSAEALSRAQDAVFEDAMRSLVELRDRLARPGAHGNIVAGVGLTRFVACLSLYRIFAHPGTTQPLQRILEGNQRGAIPPWEVLTKSLREESAGVVHLNLKSTAPLRERLMELLREAKRLGETVDLGVAEREGPYWAVGEAIMHGKDPCLAGIPSNLDHVSLSGLLVNLTQAEAMAYSATWWNTWAQTHNQPPGEFAAFAKEYKTRAQTQATSGATNPVTGKEYEARDLFVQWQQKTTLVLQAIGMLTFNPLGNRTYER
jgi:hypothetical protein